MKRSGSTSKPLSYRSGVKGRREWTFEDDTKRIEKLQMTSTATSADYKGFTVGLGMGLPVFSPSTGSLDEFLASQNLVTLKIQDVITAP
jgi:hypothetical protein